MNVATCQAVTVALPVLLLASGFMHTRVLESMANEGWGWKAWISRGSLMLVFMSTLAGIGLAFMGINEGGFDDGDSRGDFVWVSIWMTLLYMVLPVWHQFLPDDPPEKRRVREDDQDDVDDEE